MAVNGSCPTCADAPAVHKAQHMDEAPTNQPRLFRRHAKRWSISTAEAVSHGMFGGSNSILPLAQLGVSRVGMAKSGQLVLTESANFVGSASGFHRKKMED